MSYFLFRLRRAWHVFKEPRDPRSIGHGTLTFKPNPTPPATDDPDKLTFAPQNEPGRTMTAPEIRQSAARAQASIIGGRSPRDVATYLLTIAGWSTCSAPVKAALRVEALILMQWMDRMLGDGDGAVRDLSVPKPKPCETCDGEGEGLEGYDAGGRHGERMAPCPDCNGTGEAGGH